MSHVDPRDSMRIPETSVPVGGKKRISRESSLLDGQFGQAFATSVTYCFIYHYRYMFKASLVPTIQISPEGFQVFLYDCRSDVMLVQNYQWGRTSLILLWAFLNYPLFFPTTLEGDALTSFGYGYPTRGGYEGAGASMN